MASVKRKIKVYLALFCGRAETTTPEYWICSDNDETFMATIDVNINVVTREQIARIYANVIAQERGIESAGLSPLHLHFADALKNRDALGLKFLSNGINGPAKKAFEVITGIALPKNQTGTWAAICRWAGISEDEQAGIDAELEVQKCKKKLVDKCEPSELGLIEANARMLYLNGYKYLTTINRHCVIVNHIGDIGYDLTKQKQSKFKHLYQSIFQCLACNI